MLDRITIIFAHKSDRRSGDVAVRCYVTNPIFGQLYAPIFVEIASANAASG
jgi:hypothetical protein